MRLSADVSVIPGTRLELVYAEAWGILSPLRLPIPPPGQDSLFKTHRPVAQPLLLESPRSGRKISARAHRRTHRAVLHSTPRHASALHSTITKLLCPAPHLRLETEKLCALHRLEERRELTLFTLLEIESLSLDLHRLVEKLRDTILIRIVAGKKLLPKLAACVALASH